MSHDPVMRSVGSDSLLIRSPRWGRMVPAALRSVDNSRVEHRSSGPIASRVTRRSARPEPSWPSGPGPAISTLTDGLGGAVARAGAVEVGQDVGGTLLQRPPQGDEFAEGGRDAVADR